MQQKTYTLVADLGNTSLTLGLFRNGKIARKMNLPKEEIREQALRQALTRVTAGLAVHGTAFGSVAPSQDARCMRMMSRMVPGPFLQVNAACDFGVKISYPKPETIGVDRLINAAWAVHQYGAPLIVCDAGTATTVDVVMTAKGFVGGVILPGPALMLDYLAERTEKLPVVQPGGRVQKSYGRSTEEAMRIGAKRGYDGMIRAVIEGMQREHPADRFTICLTGGHARNITLPDDMNAHADPDLTLRGLGLIYERTYLNKPS